MSSNRADEEVAVITDAGCMIILEKLSAFHLLHQLFNSIYITPEIAAEYGKPLPGWITVISVKNTSLQQQFSLKVDFRVSTELYNAVLNKAGEI